MSRVLPYLFLSILLVGAVLTALGMVLWSKAEFSPTSRFYIIPVHFVPSNGYYWTWGMEGNSGTEPDAWHFHVVFAANETAVVALLWNTNQSVLFSKTSAKMTETFVVELPRTGQPWRWDWVIKNPDRLTLLVENFTIVHYSIKYPERQKGVVLFSVGLAATLTATVAQVYVSRRHSQPMSHKSSRSS
jgi:hypothetical protein